MDGSNKYYESIAIKKVSVFQLNNTVIDSLQNLLKTRKTLAIRIIRYEDQDEKEREELIKYYNYIELQVKQLLGLNPV